MGMKFYPWVVFVSDMRFGRYEHGYYLPPTGNLWISKIKLNHYLGPAENNAQSKAQAAKPN
jgi:hypothetical protein